MVLLFDEVEGLSQVNWHDVGMHVALQCTEMVGDDEAAPQICQSPPTIILCIAIFG